MLGKSSAFLAFEAILREGGEVFGLLRFSLEFSIFAESSMRILIPLLCLCAKYEAADRSRLA